MASIRAMAVLAILAIVTPTLVAATGIKLSPPGIQCACKAPLQYLAVKYTAGDTGSPNGERFQVSPDSSFATKCQINFLSSNLAAGQSKTRLLNDGCNIPLTCGTEYYIRAYAEDDAYLKKSDPTYVQKYQRSAASNVITCSFDCPPTQGQGQEPSGSCKKRCGACGDTNKDECLFKCMSGDDSCDKKCKGPQGGDKDKDNNCKKRCSPCSKGDFDDCHGKCMRDDKNCDKKCKGGSGIDIGIGIGISLRGDNDKDNQCKKRCSPCSKGDFDDCHGKCMRGDNNCDKKCKGVSGIDIGVGIGISIGGDKDKDNNCKKRCSPCSKADFDDCHGKCMRDDKNCDKKCKGNSGINIGIGVGVGIGLP